MTKMVELDQERQISKQCSLNAYLKVELTKMILYSATTRLLLLFVALGILSILLIFGVKKD